MDDAGLWPDRRRSELLAVELDKLVRVPRDLVVLKTAAHAIELNCRLPIVHGPSFGPVALDQSITQSANLDSAVGAGGPDASGRSGARWEYGHLIRRGLDVRLMLSNSATAPIIPAGYAWAGCWTAAYVHSDGNFINFQQYGRTVQWLFTNYNALSAGGGRLLADGHATSYTAVGASSRIPVGISRIINSLFILYSSTANATASWRTTGSSGSENQGVYVPPSSLGSSLVLSSVDASGSFDYKVTFAADTLYIDTTGYTITSF